MKIKLFGSLLIAVLAITSIVQAQTHTPIANQRQHNPQHRSNQDSRSGKLTHNKANHSRSGGKKTSRNNRTNKARGRVTPGGHKQLGHEQNKTSRTISHDKHNGR
jgi:ABC-type nickel/cobalt efflux system permease component RcnA